MDMESFEDIIKGYDGRKPSAFNLSFRKASYAEVFNRRKAAKVQPDAKADSSVHRTEDYIKDKSYDINNKWAKEYVKGRYTDQKKKIPKSRRGRSRVAAEIRPKGSQTTINRDEDNDTFFTQDMNGVKLGRKDALDIQRNPRYKYYQPTSRKYQVALQNLGGRNTKLMVPYLYVDWNGNLTKDRTKAMLVDKKTGKPLDAPPKGMSLEEMMSRYYPRLAIDEFPDRPIMYATGKEKDAMREAEIARAEQWELEYAVSTKAQQMAEDYGLPYDYVYDAIYDDVAAQFFEEQENARIATKQRDAALKEAQQRAMASAKMRLAQDEEIYNAWVEGGKQGDAPIEQPKSTYIVGNGTTVTGHFSMQPQLYEYYREELAKELGLPAPAKPEEYDQAKYINSLVQAHPSLKAVLSRLTPEQLEYLHDVKYDFNVLFKDDGTPRFKPSQITNRLKEYVKYAKDEDKNLEDEQQKKLQAAQTRREDTAKRWAEKNVLETPQMTSRRRAAELEANIRARLMNLLSNHDKNRSDPVEIGSKLQGMANNYSQLALQYNNLRRSAKPSNAQKAKLDELGKRLRNHQALMWNNAQELGLDPANVLRLLDDVNVQQGGMYPGFDPETYEIDPRLRDYFTGPKRRYDQLKQQAENPKTWIALQEEMRTSGKLPKIVGAGAGKNEHIVSEDEADTYSQLATDLYWKLIRYGGLTRDVSKRLDSLIAMNMHRLNKERHTQDIKNRVDGSLKMDEDGNVITRDPTEFEKQREAGERQRDEGLAREWGLWSGILHKCDEYKKNEPNSPLMPALETLRKEAIARRNNLKSRITPEMGKDNALKEIESKTRRNDKLVKETMVKTLMRKEAAERRSYGADQLASGMGVTIPKDWDPFGDKALEALETPKSDEMPEPEETPEENEKREAKEDFDEEAEKMKEEAEKKKEEAEKKKRAKKEAEKRAVAEAKAQEQQNMVQEIHKEIKEEQEVKAGKHRADVHEAAELNAEQKQNRLNAMSGKGPGKEDLALGRSLLNASAERTDNIKPLVDKVQPIKVPVSTVGTRTNGPDVKPLETEKPETEKTAKSWSMSQMENMSIREMMQAIAKSDEKEGHPYGKPIQGNVFAYGSTISTLGDGRDRPMPDTIPTKKENDEGATSRKLDL